MNSFLAAPDAPAIVQRIRTVVANACDITPQMLLVQFGRTSKRANLARMLVAYLLRELTDYSTPRIGALLGYSDHTTVLYASRKIRSLIDTSPEDREFVLSLFVEVKKDEKFVRINPELPAEAVA